MTVLDAGTAIITGLGILLGLFLIAFAVGCFIRGGSGGEEDHNP